jgi:MraZ protein
MGESGSPMLLTGTFPRTFDEKLRIAIPKPLKDELALQEGSVLYVTPGTDGSLAIYSPEVLEQLAARLAASSPTGRDVRTFARLFYAQAFRADIDKQGRVRLSQELVNLAGIAKEAVLVGAGDHLELWDKARWEAYLAQNQPQYDEIAEAAFQPKL